MSLLGGFVDRRDADPVEFPPVPSSRAGAARRLAADVPLKETSYAIQDTPWRPWPQLLALTALVVSSLVSLFHTRPAALT